MAWGNIKAQPMYGDRHLEPEQEMWIAVLARAVHDAFGSADYLEANKAIIWLKGYSKDFRDVCEYAGRDPKYVHQKLIKEVTKREKYFHDLKHEPYERKRVNDARKITTENSQINL
tara:strand:+ start:91 stop:438 length:348 start_codon:yes stop_codon:yes gene_type:complete